MAMKLSSNIKVAVLVSGSGSNLQAIIDASKNDRDFGAEVVLVISNREKAYGLKRAELENIDHFCIKDNEEVLKKLKEYEIDLVVLAGYLKIIPESIIDEFPNRIINIHPSLIPSFCGMGYYGLKVHEAAIERGVKVSGCTTHFVNKMADAGPIILQKVVDVDFSYDADRLQQEILKEEHKILPESIKLFAHGKLEVVGNRVKIRSNNWCVH